MGSAARLPDVVHFCSGSTDETALAVVCGGERHVLIGNGSAFS
jgi:hypothetical protein